MVNSYYIESKDFYINGFAEYIEQEVGEVNAIDGEDVNKMFKYYMYDYKNIKVDLRQPFWREVLYLAMKKAGYVWGGNF